MELVRLGVYGPTLTEAELRQGLVALIIGHLTRDYVRETAEALTAAGWQVTPPQEEQL